MVVSRDQVTTVRVLRVTVLIAHLFVLKETLAMDYPYDLDATLS